MQIFDNKDIIFQKSYDQSMNLLQNQAPQLEKLTFQKTQISSKYNFLNIVGIERYPELQKALPRAWSTPVLASHIRGNLRIPLVKFLYT